MGTADLVPGVSGGTIALVLGIYERLVASIRRASSALGNLVRGDLAGARNHSGKIEWVFLVPLLVGILAAIATLAGFLEHQLEERPTVLAGVFLGLVLGSVAIAWRLIKQTNTMHVVIVALVGLALFFVLGLGEGPAIGDPSPLALIGAGGLAICAMILPGISGSLILLMLGMYSAVLGAVEFQFERSRAELNRGDAVELLRRVLWAVVPGPGGIPLASDLDQVLLGDLVLAPAHGSLLLHARRDQAAHLRQVLAAMKAESDPRLAWPGLGARLEAQLVGTRDFPPRRRQR